jgi:antitoxin HicB
MTMPDFRYPVLIEPEGGGVTIHVRDFGGATQADPGVDPVQVAEDFIGTWIDMLIEDGAEIPAPSPPQPGEQLVAAPIDAATQALLHSRMRELGISKVELARRMGKDEKEIRRMLDPRHGTRLQTFRAAFRALGIHPELRVA